MKLLLHHLLNVVWLAGSAAADELRPVHGRTGAKAHHTRFARRGVDVLTAQEDGAARLSDSDLLDRAQRLGRILFSMDEDLVVEATTRQRQGRSFATVVYARQMEASIGGSISDLEIIAKAADQNDAQGQVIFL